MTQPRIRIIAPVLALLPACVLPDMDDPASTTASNADASASADGSASETDVDDGPEASTSIDSESSGDESASDSTDDGSTSSMDTENDTNDGLSSAVAIRIAVGRLHACAVTAESTVRCWGYSNVGQLGNGAALDDVAFRVPVAVEGLADIASISSFADHTCALDGAGVAWCWGANDYGQLGDGSTTTAAVPVAVAGRGFTAIDAGVGHSCAITIAGSVQCWGHNDYGQLGDGTTDDRTAPVDVAGLGGGVVAVSAGRDHTCAVRDDGSLRCWGGDTYGELGNGEPLSASPTPVAVPLGSPATDVAAGDNDTCVIDDAGGAWCWGKNADGQLGNGESGTLVESHSPTAVVGLDSGTSTIAPGFGYTCAVVSGATMCWGDNFDLVLGNGEEPGFESPVPVDVVGLGSGSVSVATCSGHACALDDAGAVRCWGSNGGGGLGDGSELDSNVPVAVVSLP